ncbi:MAG: nucleotidyl transferase AbiEii/AbiGii toxin family protein [PVC group bacterium]
MKDYALQVASSRTGYNEKLNCLREYLQAYILRILFDDGFFDLSAFVGGSALRFLYRISRFSEDLDFSATGGELYPFEPGMLKLKRELEMSGYDVTVKYNAGKTVQYAMIGFVGIMFEAGISPHRNQKLSIKIDIDTRPPEGAILATHISDIYFPLAYITYDLPSLFAGKLNALLCRSYTKGRDFFDLGWYLSRWPGLSPNFNLLHNGLRQTGWEGPFPSENDWRLRLSRVVDTADWKMVEQDVTPFLERPADLNIITQKNVLHLLAVEGKGTV